MSLLELKLSLLRQAYTVQSHPVFLPPCGIVRTMQLRPPEVQNEGVEFVRWN
jgi:hypothetical protein